MDITEFTMFADGWMDGWMDGWRMGGWMGGWMDETRGPSAR